MKGWVLNRDPDNHNLFRNEDSPDRMKLLANETTEKVLELARDHRKDVFTFKLNVALSKPVQTANDQKKDSDSNSLHTRPAWVFRRIYRQAKV